jgi:small GTP-binding protein
MGGKHTVEYRTDPAVLEMLQQQKDLTESLIKRLNDADAAAKVAKDPKVFNMEEEKIFRALLQGLVTMDFVDALPAMYKCKKNVLFIGDVSVGKSSLINFLYGTDLKVAVGHETKVVTAVHETARTIIWDAPGNNRDFSYYDPDALNFIHSVDLVLILYQSSLSTVDKIFAVVHTIKKKNPNSVFVVRTKCDMFSDRDQRTVQQEVEVDRQFLQQQGAGNVRIFTTSAHGGGFQNDELKRELTG